MFCLCLSDKDAAAMNRKRWKDVAGEMMAIVSKQKVEEIQITSSHWALFVLIL